MKLFGAHRRRRRPSSSAAVAPLGDITSSGPAPTSTYAGSNASSNGSSFSDRHVQTPLAQNIEMLRNLRAAAADERQQATLDKIVESLMDVETLMQVGAGRQDVSIFLQTRPPVTSHDNDAPPTRLSVNAQRPSRASDAAADQFMPFELEELLTHPHWRAWSFDVRELDRPLQTFAEALFFHHQLCSSFGIDEQVLSSFFEEIEARYCFDPNAPNAYHTALHGADVLASVAHFASLPVVSELLSIKDALALFVAAAVHDFRHPGVNQSFLVSTRHELALRYNDTSVLENLHVSEAFRVMFSNDRDLNWSKSLSEADLRSFRSTVIKLVLATDLSQSFKYVSKFKSNFLPSNGEGPKPLSTLTTDSDNALVLMQMLLKCADIAHPAKKWQIHETWSEMVAAEFFHQGDQEKSLGMPVSPLCDRTTESLPRSQVGFIKFVVRPCFTPLVEFCSAYDQRSKDLAAVWARQIDDNAAKWQQMVEEATLADLNSESA